jgi:hypothetical protein
VQSLRAIAPGEELLLDYRFPKNCAAPPVAEEPSTAGDRFLFSLAPVRLRRQTPMGIERIQRCKNSGRV